MYTVCIACCIAIAGSLAPTPGTDAQSTGSAPAQRPDDQRPSVAERVAAMKTSMAESQKRLRGYEWIETTVVSLEDKEHSHTQQRCYWGADGKLQKVPVVAAPEPERPRGIRGRIAEKKKGELTDYMKRAVELVKHYVPPAPEAIEKARAGGNVAIVVLEPGKRIRLDFTDYLMPDDSLKAEMNLADDRLTAISVSSFVEDDDGQGDKKDPVTLTVRMGALADGTQYTEEIVLEAESKDIKVTIANTGYRKLTK